MVTYTATYSPEDNKLRLYASARLDSETFERLKAAGFRWAPKQELFVAPKWSPAREDLLTELAGEIEAEEMTLAERAAIKAERLDGYAAKRHAEANAYSRRSAEIAERFYMGQPILVGHHSERSARRDQEKMHAAERKAHKLAETANYWLYRAEGCEHHANRKNDPRVRARRIKTLLAELRDLQRGINEAHNALRIWDKFTTPEDIRKAIGGLPSSVTFVGMGDYFAVDKGEKTPEEVRESAIERARATIEGPSRRRWIEHTLNRLGYERALLGDVKRYEGELTPVILQTFARTHGAEKPKASETDPGSFELESPVPLPLHLASGKVLDLTADEWRDLMQSVGYEVPEAKPRKAVKPQAAGLINPTAEQAAQLQRIWNARKEAGALSRGSRVPLKERNVTHTTQAIYSSNAKGSYGCCRAEEIDARGEIVREQWHRMERVRSAEPVARIRINTRGGELYGPDSVVHLTDKPAKPLPIDLDALEAEALAALEALRNPPAPDFSQPFDPAKVGIERVRQSVTQGHVVLTYDGRKIGEYGDKQEIANEYRGHPDSHWVDVARRIHAGELKAAA